MQARGSATNLVEAAWRSSAATLTEANEALSHRLELLGQHFQSSLEVGPVFSSVDHLEGNVGLAHASWTLGLVVATAAAPDANFSSICVHDAFHVAAIRTNQPRDQLKFACFLDSDLEDDVALELRAPALLLVGLSGAGDQSGLVAVSSSITDGGAATTSGPARRLCPSRGGSLLGRLWLGVLQLLEFQRALEASRLRKHRGGEVL
mmetsp:Transcript_42897/g.91991  ORF Transcript_42897/g.91991 Transcript_42897/m.91991 type:complete len:206 (-) Transcript_42897:985-1602(-)